MSMTLKEVAIKYATKYDWAVFPVNPDTKRPLTPHGCNDAKKDVGAIDFWWNKWPDASIGVATGSASNLIVIDEDIDETKDINGYHEVRLWEKDHTQLPDTVQVLTGRGGCHLYYHYAGNDIKNRAGIIEGVDIRGEGGYVIAPPSKHPNGNSYVWEASPDEIQLAEVDETVLDFLFNQPNDYQETEPFSLPEVIPMGSRNDTLFKMACSLQSKGFPDSAINAAMRAVNNERCAEPVGDDELDRIITSSLKYQKGGIEITSDPIDIPVQKEHKIRKLKTATGLMAKDIPEPRVIVGVGSDLPFLVEGTCILSAKPKLGKSWLALALCLAVAKGEDFLGYKTRCCSTLYLDLETSESIQKKRLLKALAGNSVPNNFYLETETDVIGKGFEEQIEAYLQEDPSIGIVVVDVFQMIRTAAKNFKETEYDHAYRDITPLNKIAQKHHIAIVLVCHDRKAVDPDDPFSNILGSTGLQGAVSQMIVMFRKQKNDPIHVSVKGKTIDGLIDMNIKIDNAQWSVVEGSKGADQEQLELDAEYMKSEIRTAVLKIAKERSGWKGKSAELIQDAIELGVPVTETAKQVGLFLHKHQGRFLKFNNVQLSIIKNGNAPKIYKITNSPLITIDETEALTIDRFEKCVNHGDSEVPFI